MQTRKEIEFVLLGNWELHYAMLEENPGDRKSAIMDVFATLLLEGIVSSGDLPVFLEIVDRNYPVHRPPQAPTDWPRRGDEK